MAFEFEINGGKTKEHYVLSNQGVGRASRYRRRTIAWERFRTIWRLPDSFILFYSDTRYIVLPTRYLSEEAQAFLLARVFDNGIRVKQL